jgi:hypothetical protein
VGRSEAGRFPGGAFTPFEGFPSSAAVPHRCGRCPPVVRPPPPHAPVAGPAQARGSLRPGEPGGIGRRVGSGSCSRTVRRITRRHESRLRGRRRRHYLLHRRRLSASAPSTARVAPRVSRSVARPGRGARFPARLDAERRSRDAPPPVMVPPPRTRRPQAPRPIASSPRASAALSRAPSGRLQGLAPPTSPFRRPPLPAGDDHSFHGLRSPPRLSSPPLVPAVSRGSDPLACRTEPRAEARDTWTGGVCPVVWLASLAGHSPPWGFSTSKSRFESGVLAAPKKGLSRSLGRNRR